MPKSLFPEADTETRARLEQNPTLKLINDYDWASNSLGPIPDWPESLKGAVRVMMAASTPMVMMIGPDGVLVYNDAYGDFAGNRHPAIFGQPATLAWPEIADFNRAHIARGLSGESLILRDQELVLDRHGRMESGWMDLHYSPVLNNDGMPLGTLCIVHETTNRVTAEKALADSELRFRTLADTMPQMVWSTLPDGFHDYYNARWYEFTGVPAGSTDGEGWNGMFHPEDQERAWSTWRLSLATGEPYEIEYRLRHHTGEYRWTLGLALPIRDSSGTIVRWIGTCTDIHATKLAAEERELVAQELSHRIKNIFAVLTGIISLSARSRPEIKPFADELRQRVYALGEAHDFVRPHSHASRSAGGQNSLRSLIERLVRPYRNADMDRVRLVGDDAAIDDGAATPLALLFHELATNAAKYGALSEAEGRVVLTGRDPGDGCYLLTWKELGGPVPSAPTDSSGFGSRVIELSVQGQLRGKLERHWESDGLRVDIEIPMEALTRSARLTS
ncbi:PAS domain-containing protein [Devosia sp. SL43]|uniref:PAS domain-containing protein n=1 Tax=Devosia sp. SL43 TaxID=2806348 RepID=UPI001F002B2D|nr:PAS domain-containing protein [Devosia sp. SL43]UJW85596.1 PAS domain-containing protein [Devosia sp. SL43]